MLRTMLMQRTLEHRGFQLNRQGKIPFASASEGHEAVQGGAAMALRRGVDLRINWPGRLAVAPVMGGLFFPMTGLLKLGEVLLYIGIALALTATALYVRTGLERLREGAPRASSSA